MKKLLTLLFLFLAASAFADKTIKPAVADDIRSYHFYAAPLQLQPAPWDDTASIQACVDAGSCTLTLGTYSVTSINVTHNLNLNGSTINGSNTTGAVFKMLTAGITLTGAGGSIVGLNSTANANGQSGVQMGAANTKVTTVAIHTFGAYGIAGGNFSSQVVTHTTISDIGYLGASFVASSNSVTGLVFSANKIDRSTQPSGVPQPALIVRAFSPGAMVSPKINSDTLIMPTGVPQNGAGECFEMRNCTGGTVNSDRFIGGSMGFSAVGNPTRILSDSCYYASQSTQAVELGETPNSKISHTTIVSGHIGFLIDGTLPNMQDTIQTANISGLTTGLGGNPYPVYVIVNTTSPLNLVLNNLTISTTTQALYITKSTGVTANNWNASGNNTTAAIFEDTAPGAVTANNCNWSGFTKLIDAYATSSTVIGNILTTNNLPTGSFLGINLLSGFVTLGSNIVFNPVTAIPVISYTPASNSYSSGAIVLLIPANTGGASSTWSITPNLATNTGIGFNTATGVISGTASIADTLLTYTVTATNAGGSGNTAVKIAVTNAPIIAYSPASYIFTTGHVSTTSAPTNTGGTPTSYALAGTLPTGLSFNTSTGVISGTPTATSLATGYTVTATNSGGHSSAVITITVNPPVPVITYTTPNTDTTGKAITPLSPTNTGGTPVSYSGTLPAGLSINTTTGVISGTPLIVSSTATYTVSATNAGGTGTFGISISVAPNLTFAAMAARTYGAANFDPGAVSATSITYTSGNTAIATIVSNQVHITGTGTVFITATSGGTSITQPVTIVKAPLTITADAKTKTVNTANPTLTVSYSGFVYGESVSALSTRPTPYTVATTSSVVGWYPITVSGARANNYVFNFNGDFLHITP